MVVVMVVVVVLTYADCCGIGFVRACTASIAAVVCSLSIQPTMGM